MATINIGLVKPEIDIIVTHEAHRTQGIGMVVREPPSPWNVVADRNLQLSGNRINASWSWPRAAP